jgi:hypothetical protein
MGESRWASAKPGEGERQACERAPSRGSQFFSQANRGNPAFYEQDTFFGSAEELDELCERENDELKLSVEGSTRRADRAVAELEAANKNALTSLRYNGRGADAWTMKAPRGGGGSGVVSV